MRVTHLLALALAVSPASATILSENFANVAGLTGSGWAILNQSNPLGSNPAWFQGIPGVFEAHAGATDSYAASNFLRAEEGGNVSAWLITPVLALDNGTTISFYSRSSGFFPDRLEVRLNTAGTTDVGVDDTTVGGFTALLLDINPSLTGSGYPTDWTLYSATISGLGGPVNGRVGFRYFITDNLTNGDYVGIDTLEIAAAVPEPASVAMSGIGALLLLRRRRNRIS